MKPLQTLPQAGCGCSEKQPEKVPAGKPFPKGKYLTLGISGLAVWFLLYGQLLPFSNFFTYTILGIKPGGHLGEAVQFFIYNTPKVMLLLSLVVFAVRILRTFFTPERIR